jgi:hypothetical protein
MRKSNSRKRGIPGTSKTGKTSIPSGEFNRPGSRTVSTNRRAALALEREIDLQDPERWDGMG